VIWGPAHARGVEEEFDQRRTSEGWNLKRATAEKEEVNSFIHFTTLEERHCASHPSPVRFIHFTTLEERYCVSLTNPVRFN
jgi:hypothetical protein